jgi:hypothetical protein
MCLSLDVAFYLAGSILSTLQLIVAQFKLQFISNLESEHLISELSISYSLQQNVSLSVWSQAREQAALIELA